MLILRQICGFSVQILPCAILCIYPFYNKFKAGKSNLFLGVFAAVFVVMASIFTFLAVCPLPEALEQYRTGFQDVVFYITLVILLVLYIFYIDAYIYKKIFVFFIIMNYGFLITVLLSIIRDIFRIQLVGDKYLYYPIVILITFLGNVVFFPQMFFLMRYVKRAMESPIERKQWKLLWIVPAAFIFILTFCYELPKQFGMAEETINEIFMLSVILIAFFIYIWIFYIIRTFQRQAEEKARLERVAENYLQVSENNAKIKEISHEIKHHLKAVSLFLNNNDYTGAQKYINTVTEEISELGVVEYTPHPLINSILTDYKNRAQKLDIKVNYSVIVSEELNIDNADICCLLTNMLENAIESCINDKNSSSFINLKIRRNGQFLFVGCENSFDASKLKYSNGRLISSKDNSSLHGYGLNIMSKIAAKYNGLFSTEIKDDTFCAFANLCLFNENKY